MRQNFDFSGYTILVVDDEMDLQEVMTDFLAMEGAHIFTASGGNEALKVLSEHKVDLVLSDIRMPGGDGVSLLRSIQKFSHEKPSLIFMTGFTDISEREALALGAKAVLQKPFHLEKMLTEISKFLLPENKIAVA